MMSGASYTGTDRQLAASSSAAESRAPNAAATRCQRPRTVSTPTMTWRKATVSPAPTGWESAKSRSGSATAHGCREVSHLTIEPRSPPSKKTGSDSLPMPL